MNRKGLAGWMLKINSHIIITIFVILFLTAALAGCSPGQQEALVTSDEADGTPRTIEIEIKGVRFNLELALNNAQRERGLMGREEISENGGMLFVLPPVDPFPAELTFWMKGCLVPIDLIFLSLEGEVTAVHAMEPPAPGTPDEKLTRYRSYGDAQFAIELRGGRAAELGVKRGDQVELPFDYLLEKAE